MPAKKQPKAGVLGTPAAGGRAGVMDSPTADERMAQLAQVRANPDPNPNPGPLPETQPQPQPLAS